MDTWWSEMETSNMNDHNFVNQSQAMTQFNEFPFNSKPFSTFTPPPPSNVISNYSYSNSMSTKNQFEKLNTFKVVKHEVPSGTTINFSSSVNSMDDSDFGDIEAAMGFGAAITTTTDQKKSYNRTSVQAQDHVLAERKRRERLTQRFIALSTLIPNLKKLDKATVLGDAIQYIKELEEQVKTLEEKNKKCSEEPVIPPAKRPRLVSSCADSSSSDEISSVSTVCTDRSLPDIEVRASDGNILIRIYCKKQNGMMKEIFNEVEKLHLSIISCSVMPFGYNTSHITIIAQMDHKLTSNTPNHVANRIRAAMVKEEANSFTA
ncbi:transcription factor bHLH18-like [Solanum lycopersicum]|uniref:BHLH domain-containing protein n=1 Tax=Solanum lycopersicum TaxID=4081 RepID=A0A3Q7FCK4_SOLLC|nr:transcription factor bHLH18-like [Solanum lycopersicum]XP_019068087.1 transcription factor bHLH18-like [Solanum lycopersicum]